MNNHDNNKCIPGGTPAIRVEADLRILRQTSPGSVLYLLCVSFMLDLTSDVGEEKGRSCRETKSQWFLFVPTGHTRAWLGLGLGFGFGYQADEDVLEEWKAMDATGNAKPGAVYANEEDRCGRESFRAGSVQHAELVLFILCGEWDRKCFLCRPAGTMIVGGLLRHRGGGQGLGSPSADERSFLVPLENACPMRSFVRARACGPKQATMFEN